jgi:hypothetical protein
MEKQNKNVESVVTSHQTETTKVKKSTFKKAKKQKLTIQWPETPFSIHQLQAKYKSAVNITLRFRINQAKERGNLVEIGKNITDQGRPTLLFCTTPVTTDKLKALKADAVELHETYKAMLTGNASVPVASFGTVEQVVPPTVIQTPTSNEVKA